MSKGNKLIRVSESFAKIISDLSNSTKKTNAQITDILADKMKRVK